MYEYINVFFFVSCSINHPTTPQIDFVTLWRGGTPRLGTTGSNYLSVLLLLKLLSTVG